MDNFRIKKPTEYVFGTDAEKAAGDILKKYGATNVLVHYGGGSVVRSGLLDTVKQSISAAGIRFTELGGAQPNPIDSLIYKGIDICKENNIDFVLAVGGGSTIDSSKAIAAGALYDGDFWDFYDGKAETCKAVLPIGTVLTIPAAGSEGSNSTVVNKVTGGGPVLKRAFVNDLLTPTFSLLNPVFNFTLPPFQTACGIADMIAHVMERYFTNTKDVEVTDRLCEAILLSIIKNAPIVLKEPENYAARANITWAGTIAHDGTCGVGREEDWSSHVLEHELSALYDVAHGAGLAVIFPAWMQYVYKHDIERFRRFAVNVWGVEDGPDKEAVALAGIAAIKEFFASLGLPVNFAQLGAKKEDINKLVEVIEINNPTGFGSFVKIDMAAARKIYEIAAE